MPNNGYAYTNYQVYEAKTPTFKAMLIPYLKYWYWFVLCLGVALSLAYIYLLYQPPIYKIEARLLIKDDKKGLGQVSALKEMDVYAPKKVLENEIEILKSYIMVDQVITNLGLEIQYFRSTTWGKREMYPDVPIRLVVEQPNPLIYQQELILKVINAKTVRVNERNYPVNQSIKTPYGRLRFFARQPLSPATELITVRVLPHAQVVEDYLQRLKIEPTSKTSTVLQLTLEDAVPAKAKAVVTQLIDTYNKASVIDKNQIANATHDFIEKRLRLISGELMAVEKDVESYKSTQGITDLSNQAAGFLQTAQQNDAQLNQVTIQLTALQEVERYVNSKANTRSTTPSTLGISDPVMLSLIAKLTELELQYDERSLVTSSKNPMLQSLENQIKATRNSISENIQTMGQMLNGTRQQLQATNQHLEGMIRTIPGKERTLLNKTRQQAIKNNLYTYLLEKREETAISYASTISDSRVVDPARGGAVPVKPVKRMVYILFGLVGFLLPVFAIAGRSILNDRIGNRSDVEEATTAPILGEIMQNRQKKALIMTSRNHSPIAEQIRVLRTNLQHLRKNSTDSQVILFTSSISGEGKSFLSLNLGASLALLHQPTVILDIDLRNPKLHKSLGMINTIGISEYLTGEASLEEVLQPVPGYPHYFIITSGALPDNPAELLAGNRLAELFRELRDRFTFILADSPPVGLMTDALLIAPFTDITLYPVRHDLTPKARLRMIDHLHREQRFNQLCLIINSVNNDQSYFYTTSKYGYQRPNASFLRRLGGRPK
ncbi:polysaccharide biosynthesis tyrosine autokinase [Larkinella ripae]